jgi:pimeloyl-ACP methyl ester carboxylesterase
MAADGAAAGGSGQHVRANGLDVYYEEYGAGPPLVAIHAGTSTILHRPAFGARFRVIAPNTRGHGRTANPSGAMSYGLLADDVAALIGALGLDRPAVVGYSVGGTTALELGMRHPDAAGALVLGGAWHRLSPSFHAALRRLNGLAGNGEADLALPERTHPHFVAEWQQTHAALGGPDYWKDLLRQLWPMVRAPLDRAEADLGRIAVPTLVVVGDRDDVAPAEEAVALYRLIPGAELAVVPGADHFLPWTHAAAYEAVVLDFLLRQGGELSP